MLLAHTSGLSICNCRIYIAWRALLVQDLAIVGDGQILFATFGVTKRISVIDRIVTG